MTKQEFIFKLKEEKRVIQDEYNKYMFNGSLDPATVSKCGELSVLFQEVDAILNMAEELEESKGNCGICKHLDAEESYEYK